jgi:hypothetical protein
VISNVGHAHRLRILTFASNVGAKKGCAPLAAVLA